VDIREKVKSGRSNLETQSSSAHSWFQVWGVSLGGRSASHLLHVLFERFVLPRKDIQVDGIGGDLAVEDLVVHRNFTNAELSGSFLHFLGRLHGQRACERNGEKRDEEEEGGDESRALHVESRNRTKGKESSELESWQIEERQDWWGSHLAKTVGPDI
jgi:hypothetical protein